MKFSSVEPNVSLSCHLKLITVYYLIIQLQNLKRRLLIENIFEKYDECGVITRFPSYEILEKYIIFFTVQFYARIEKLLK